MARALLRPEQVAEWLGMSLSWVYGNKHLIGYLQFGAAIRFEQCAVERYAESCKRGPQPEERDTWESQSDIGKRETVGWSRKRTTVNDISARLRVIEREKGKHENTPHSARQK
nr:helix-turn-helix domain-containing protein [uncultured Halomonas sp.]